MFSGKDELLEARKRLPFERLRKDVYADLGKFKTGGTMVLAVAVFRRLGPVAF